MKPSIKYMKQVCSDRYQQFGAAGNATKIKQIALDDFAKKYASGELAAKTKGTVAV
jgi:fructose-bisphosphate aldolase class II